MILKLKDTMIDVTKQDFKQYLSVLLSGDYNLDAMEALYASKLSINTYLACRLHYDALYLEFCHK